MYNRLGNYNPATFSGTTVNFINKGITAGEIFAHQNGYLYRVVKMSTALTRDVTANGEVLCWEDISTWTVTNDVSASILGATTPWVAGVAMGAIPESGATTSTDSWGLILIRGYHSSVLTDAGDDIAENDLLCPSTAVDGACDRLLFTTATIPDPTDGLTTADLLRDELVAANGQLPSIRKAFLQTQYSLLGWATDDDVNATDRVPVYVHVRF